MGEGYGTDTIRMPMIAGDLLGRFRFDGITVVERFDLVGPILRVLEDLILLSEREVKIWPAIERYWLF